jgi:hypothetical protein
LQEKQEARKKSKELSFMKDGDKCDSGMTVSLSCFRIRDKEEEEGVEDKFTLDERKEL